MMQLTVLTITATEGPMPFCSLYCRPNYILFLNKHLEITDKKMSNQH